MKTARVEPTHQNPAAPLLRAALGSPSKPLAPEERTFFEPRFGHDFANVRVHADAPAAALTRALGAHALTVGSSIFFDHGERNPVARQDLLAHELAHVVQQRGHSATGTSIAIGYRGDTYEREADRAADAVFSPDVDRPALSRASGASLQGSFYSEAKEKGYDALILGLRRAKVLLLAPIRNRVGSLSEDQRPLLEAQIDLVDDVLDIEISLAVAMVGMGAGFGEGIVALVQGIWSLLEGTGKYLVTFLWGFVDGGQLFNRHHSEVLHTFSQLGPGLVALCDDFKKRWAAASPERQSIMIGELTGQVLAFLATMGGAAAKASTLPSLALLEPGAFMQPAAGGVFAMAGAGATVSAETLAASGGAVLMSQVYVSKTKQAATESKAAAAAAARREGLLKQFPRSKGVYVLINKRIQTGYVGMSAGQDGIFGRLSDITHAKAIRLLEEEGTYGYWMEISSKEGLIGNDLVRVIKLSEQNVLESRAAQFGGKVLFTNSGRAELSLQTVADWLAEGIYDAKIVKEGMVKPVY